MPVGVLIGAIRRGLTPRVGSYGRLDAKASNIPNSLRLGASSMTSLRSYTSRLKRTMSVLLIPLPMFFFRSQLRAGNQN